MVIVGETKIFAFVPPVLQLNECVPETPSQVYSPAQMVGFAETAFIPEKNLRRRLMVEEYKHKGNYNLKLMYRPQVMR